MKTGTSTKLVGCLSRDYLLMNRQRNSNLLISGGMFFSFQGSDMDGWMNICRDKGYCVLLCLLYLSFGGERSPHV